MVEASKEPRGQDKGQWVLGEVSSQLGLYSETSCSLEEPSRDTVESSSLEVLRTNLDGLQDNQSYLGSLLHGRLDLVAPGSFQGQPKLSYGSVIDSICPWGLPGCHPPALTWVHLSLLDLQAAGRTYLMVSTGHTALNLLGGFGLLLAAHGGAGGG